MDPSSLSQFNDFSNEKSYLSKMLFINTNEPPKISFSENKFYFSERSYISHLTVFTDNTQPKNS